MTSSKNRAPLTLAELARAVEGELCGDGQVEIHSVAPIEDAAPGDLAFVANPHYIKHIETTRASALVLDLETPCSRLPVIRHANPYLVFAKIIDALYPDPILVSPGVHASAVVEAGAVLCDGAAVGPLCHVRSGATIGRNTQLVSSVYIGDNVTIGESCLLHPGVRILHGTKIGDNVIIHSGTVVGSDGFGFAQGPTGHKKIKQVGWVEIGSDVEIGANVTIDRGALGPTQIGRGTKIDNLVQIAHNVEVGEHCIIVSQVGISGSTKLGDRIMLGGQVGLTGHLQIGDDVKVGAQSGVHKSIPAGKVYFGSPARDIMETKKIEAAMARLPELLKRVRKLEAEVKKSQES